MKIFLYDKERFIDGYFVKSKEDFLENPLNYCNEWNDEIIVSEIEYRFPVFADGKLHEASREERVLKYGKTKELLDGEIIENNGIKTIKKPESLIRPVWDSKNGTWLESMTKEELLINRKNKIINYIDIKNEIEKLKESEFESEETVAILESKLQELKIEINKLADNVKKLKEK